MTLKKENHLMMSLKSRSAVAHKARCKTKLAYFVIQVWDVDLGTQFKKAYDAGMNKGNTRAG